MSDVLAMVDIMVTAIIGGVVGGATAALLILTAALGPGWWRH